ncbi:hypothetical protein BDW62DRAFT_184339 [Aspergillus aurantiobrunneus]
MMAGKDSLILSCKWSACWTQVIAELHQNAASNKENVGVKPGQRAVLAGLFSIALLVRKLGITIAAVLFGRKLG